jgi:hypothetical protein
MKRMDWTTNSPFYDAENVVFPKGGQTNAGNLLISQHDWILNYGQV